MRRDRDWLAPARRPEPGAAWRWIRSAPLASPGCSHQHAPTAPAGHRVVPAWRPAHAGVRYRRYPPSAPSSGPRPARFEIGWSVCRVAWQITPVTEDLGGYGPISRHVHLPTLTHIKPRAASSEAPDEQPTRGSANPEAASATGSPGQHRSIRRLHGPGCDSLPRTIVSVGAAPTTRQKTQKTW